ncbi:hypothetical protein JW916_12940 [Candidatus Sumerlaeota bacterium]|nr:hypothetical protein [Candidatus Sumerlaeota bacterium]
MPSKPDAAQKILSLLIENEEAAAELYRAYGTRFVETQALWAGLAAEERSHAAQLRTLSKSLEIDVSRAGPTFDPVWIQEGIDRAKEETSRAQRNEITLQQALETAIEIERGMIEKGFFEIFDGHDERAQGILRGLRGLTENHQRRLVEFAGWHGPEDRATE